MLIIFGIGNKKLEEKHSSKTEHCSHCNNTTHWIATKSNAYVSIFFLPIFPYKTSFAYHCPICNHGRLISKEEYYNLI